MGFVTYLLTALTLILVLEGLAYALFTPDIKRLMRLVLTLPDDQLRRFGWVMAATGLVTLAVLHQMGG